MSREEAAALVLAGGYYHTDAEQKYWESEAQAALSDADAHDAAHGVHRVSLDDATVERAARALLAEVRPNRPWDGWQDYWKDMARAVLAAAVEVQG